MKIVLGSSSPRRQKILASLVDNFDINAPDVDETAHHRENPLDFTIRVSRDKARNVESFISHTSNSVLIITADTIVTIGNRIMGKPVDFNEAHNFLGILSGRTHSVITSITLLTNGMRRDMTPVMGTYSEITGVTFKRLSDQDIDEYLYSIDYIDKAGAYAFQENGSRIIEHINGSMTNIIGFPLRSFFIGLADLNMLTTLF